MPVEEAASEGVDNRGPTGDGLRRFHLLVPQWGRGRHSLRKGGQNNSQAAAAYHIGHLHESWIQTRAVRKRSTFTILYISIKSRVPRVRWLKVALRSDRHNLEGKGKLLGLNSSPT